MALVKKNEGNRSGRPKGSKNKSTILKQALNHQFDVMLKKQFKLVMECIIDQAKDGCRASQKLLVDKIIPSCSSENSRDSALPNGGVTVIIGEMTPKRVEGVTINQEEES